MRRYCTENSIQIFPETELLGLFPNFNIHVSVSDLSFPMIDHGKMYKSQIHNYRNKERGRAVAFLGTQESDLVCSAEKQGSGQKVHSVPKFSPIFYLMEILEHLF
jgi:hypothetical protein